MAESEELQVDPAKLWKNFKDDPSIENKNELLLHYLHLVKKVVLRLMPIYKMKNEYEDLLSNGIIGLMDAINKFDQMRNVKFETYALKRIRGEVLDYMRKQDWVSSSMRTRIKKVNQAYETLTMERGHEPDEQEVGELLGLNTQQVREALDNAYLYNIIYFESVIASNFKDESVRLIDTVKDNNEETAPQEFLEKKELLATLTSILEQLPENEKKVINLYYKDELLLKEIASILKVSESRVSQIHSKAIRRIQTQLKLQMRDA